MKASEYRDQLYQIFLTSGADVETEIQRALDLGREYLNLSLGFVTEIKQGEQSIVHVSGNHNTIKPGGQCPLDEAYCRKTITLDSALAVQDVSASPSINDRAHQRFNLDTYVGAKILVHNDSYGTVCFASKESRTGEFTDPEVTFVEILARLIGQALERNRFEQELRARSRHLELERDRFKTIADTTFDLLFRFDLEGKFTYVSSASERILGYEPEEMVGEPFAKFNMTKESTERAFSAYETVLQGEDIEAIELDIVTADGETAILEVNGTPARRDGEIVGAHGVARDITLRKERERELAIKDQAIDEAQVGVTIADAQHSDIPLVYVNEGFEQITGYERSEVLGRNCRFLQGEATDPDAVNVLRDGIRSGKSVGAVLVNYRNDGSPFSNQIRISPVTDDDDEVTHFLGIQTDITQQKRREQLIRVLNRVLRHNLRNDMGVITGLASLIEDTPSDSSTELASTIKETGERLTALAERARDLEDAASGPLEPDRLNPRELFEELIPTYRDQFPNATITLEFETESEVCAGSQLREAMSELIENALQHNHSPTPQVVVEVARQKDWVVITVEDDGPGIDESEAAVIAKGEEHALEHGSGLGLWLVNWVVTHYGGSFQIQPKQGDEGGSCATVKLPGIAPNQPVKEAARRPTILFW